MNISNPEYDLSIVATIYNDARIVEPLIQEIEASIRELNLNYEIILVNDHSSDNSEEAIKKACQENPDIKGISLSRNFGQQIAMSAGMHYASGRYVVIMDGDLQNPPSVIPRLYQKIREGFDIVYTVSETRNHYFDEITSKLMWAMLTKLFGVKIVPNQLMMKIMTRDFVSHFRSYQEIQRLVAGIAHDIGMNYAVLEVDNRKRTIGSSNYNLFKRFDLLIDIVIGLTVSPLVIMIHFGVIVLLLTTLVSIYELFTYFFSNVPPGFTSIILSIFFFSSIIIILLGIIGKYLSNIYIEVKNRPLFFVQNKYNL